MQPRDALIVGQVPAAVLDRPARPGTAPDPVYAATAEHASCPATTGVGDHGGVCNTHEDGAHRCTQRRDRHATHTCTDGFRWYVTGSMPFGRMNARTPLPFNREAK